MCIANLDVKEKIAKKAWRIIQASLEELLPTADETPEERDELRKEIIGHIGFVVGCYHGSHYIVPTKYLAKKLESLADSREEEGKCRLASELRGLSIQLETVAGEQYARRYRV